VVELPLVEGEADDGVGASGPSPRQGREGGKGGWRVGAEHDD
jgi:hypothetical protein